MDFLNNFAWHLIRTTPISTNIPLIKWVLNSSNLECHQRAQSEELSGKCEFVRVTVSERVNSVNGKRRSPSAFGTRKTRSGHLHCGLSHPPGQKTQPERVFNYFLYWILCFCRGGARCKTFLRRHCRPRGESNFSICIKAALLIASFVVDSFTLMEEWNFQTYLMSLCPNLGYPEENIYNSNYSEFLTENCTTGKFHYLMFASIFNLQKFLNPAWLHFHN